MLSVATNPAQSVGLPLALLIIFGSAKLLAEVAERCGMPGIIGEIAAGILVGPSVLNWVQPDQTLSALAEMGVMFLLFNVGLEVKASELMRLGSTAAARDAGKYRLEGKEYVFQDGDVTLFRFNN